MYSIASSENVHGGWKVGSAWVLVNTSTYTRETRGPERESKLYALCAMLRSVCEPMPRNHDHKCVTLELLLAHE